MSVVEPILADTVPHLSKVRKIWINSLKFNLISIMSCSTPKIHYDFNNLDSQALNGINDTTVETLLRTPIEQMRKSDLAFFIYPR